jgi:L-amino acid N-acyltransferase YncA
MPRRRQVIRLARATDLPAIVAVYNEAIATGQSTADTQPVSVEDRRVWFEEHHPDAHPIFVADVDGLVVGWCSLSAYRPGRQALRFTAEVSYYVAQAHQRRGIGTALLNQAIAACPRLRIKRVFAILLESNAASRELLRSLRFDQWGFLPKVADFDGRETGHVYFGRQV